MEIESSTSDEEADVRDKAFEGCASLSVLDDSDDAELPGADEDFRLGVRCAAHTLQLAVSDALRESRACTIIAESLALVKKIRVQSAMALLRSLERKKPVIDCPTRGGQRLHAGQADRAQVFAKTFLSEEERLRWTESAWAQVEMLTASLQPAQVGTKMLHSQQLTIGDFYGTWLTCFMDTCRISSPLAKALAQSIQNRERDLCDMNIFCAVLYIGPRYQLILTTEQKSQARLHLVKTWQPTVELQRKQQDESINQAGAFAAVPRRTRRRPESISMGKGRTGWCAP
ncbi:hypothetical protein HPB48_003057 [Haemaphysalis longicornis]|uniref:Uncharacterized protein n=1 Tax=Haemaphysalis longicornis TaxID=44386 RepID=A0A9J6GKW7_HAELO|nr:hypothetical protein HPB48_003057 [Haemaphysalis longicornis]